MVGQRIASARRTGPERRVTQAELAKFLGVTPQAVSGWERGESMPETEKLSRIADFLSTSVGWILNGEAHTVTMLASGPITHVPLVDTVPAGKLALPMSQLDTAQLPLLAFSDLGRGDFIALTVEGDSMDRISPSSSIIVINKDDRALVSGKPYVFCHRGQVTFKIWRPNPARLQPYSTNPVHDPIYVTDKSEAEKMVVGRVKRTVLDF